MPEVTQDWGSEFVEKRDSDPELLAKYAELEARYNELKAEADAAAASESSDPLAPENVPVVTLITVLRIYDVMSALLDHFDPKMAEKVLNAHEEGKILGPPPRIA